MKAYIFVLLVVASAAFITAQNEDASVADPNANEVDETNPNTNSEETNDEPITAVEPEEPKEEPEEEPKEEPKEPESKSEESKEEGTIVPIKPPENTVQCFDNEKKNKECNACRCEKNKWWCTTEECTNTYEPECEAGDVEMRECNKCRCDGGFWACTSNDCPKPAFRPSCFRRRFGTIVVDPNDSCRACRCGLFSIPSCYRRC